MSSMTIFILFVSIIALLFLFINLVFAPHNPYQEKDSMFECGFHSFQQSRSPFNIAFFIYALVFLLLDLEILLIFPFAVSGYVNNIYGLIITLVFVSIITTGFVFELGKGALNIPSKQYTYTIKNKPLIHISYVKTKGGGILKPHPFITSPSLESSIFPFTIFIKKIGKYLTLKNITIGLISFIVMSFVKTLHVPMSILNFLNLENLESLEYIILGFLGLVSGLGLKGLAEGIFIDNYATMGGEDPTQKSSSGSKAGGVGATDTSEGDFPERQSSSDGDRQSESKSSPDSNTQDATGVDTQMQESSSSNPSGRRQKYSTAERLAKVFDKTIANLVEEAKNLSISMDKAKDDEE